MFCKYCGKMLSDNAMFCSKCGNRLFPAAMQKVDPENHDEASSPEKIDVLENNKTEIISKDKTEENRIQSDGSEEFDKKETSNVPPMEIKTDNADSLNVSQKFCRYCGNQIPETSSFCPKCGKQIAKPIIPKTYETQTSDIAKQKAEPENQQEKFRVRNLFVGIFKKHTSKERNEILKSGMGSEKSADIKITAELFKPWLYSRIFIILLAVFAVFEICLLSFNNSNMMPGVMLIGSLIMPFTLLTLYFELNVYRDISFFKVMGIFLLGGAISLLFTLFLYNVVPVGSDYTFLNASLISVIEELGKAAIVIVLLIKSKNVTPLKGLLIGGAIGAGFAVFESAGYAFNAFLDAHDSNVYIDMANANLPWYYQYDYVDSIGQMNLNIFLRSILSFGGHTAWAAIEGAAFGYKKKINFTFIKYFGICFILHALWDTDTPAAYLKLAILCLAAWWIIVRQISRFVKENSIGGK